MRYISLLLIGCTLTSDPMLDPDDAGRDAGTPDAGSIDGGFYCEEGIAGCWGDTHYVCGPDDTRTEEIACDDACDPALGCVTCVPGSRSCDGTISRVCALDGSGWTFGRDCDDWGVECGESGYCDDACAAAEATRSYVGCEYWPAPLANHPSLAHEEFDFRVVVANPGQTTAEITVFRGARIEARESIPPGGAIEVPLDWIDGQSFPFADHGWRGTVVRDGAYRLISSSPVIVSQFNPFHYALRGRFSFSNDASLLLPTHALGDEPVGASYPALWAFDGLTSGGWPGYLAVVGVYDETRVTVHARANIAADRTGRWPAAAPGETIEFTLSRGEVAQLVAADPPPCGPDRPGFREISDGAGYCDEPTSDLTGTRIVSDHPVAAFGGHTCAHAPIDVAACDHLETTLAPLRTWGTRFRTMPLRDPETSVPNLVRVIAARDGTTVTIDGRQASLDAGEHLERSIDGAIAIDADAPIQVAQILLGQDITDPPQERGDPGLTMLVPEEQFRSEYVFVTPSSYTPVVQGQSWLLVSRDPGVEVVLDGAPIDAEWTLVGARELAIVPVSGGAHRASSASPFGVIAYGLGLYTSYAYPAGLDLRIVPI
jgi:hypothetical protein